MYASCFMLTQCLVFSNIIIYVVLNTWNYDLHKNDNKHIILYTVKWGNFGRWGNFGQYETSILSNIFCHLKNNLVVKMEVKGYLQSVICFKRSFIRLDPMIS